MQHDHRYWLPLHVAGLGSQLLHAVNDLIADRSPLMGRQLTAGTVVPSALRPPQALGGKSCPLDQRRKLGPHDGRVLALVHRPLGKPAVGPGDDPLAAH